MPLRAVLGARRVGHDGRHRREVAGHHAAEEAREHQQREAAGEDPHGVRQGGPRERHEQRRAPAVAVGERAPERGAGELQERVERAEHAPRRARAPGTRSGPLRRPARPGARRGGRRRSPAPRAPRSARAGPGRAGRGSRSPRDPGKRSGRPARARAGRARSRLPPQSPGSDRVGQPRANLYGPAGAGRITAAHFRAAPCVPPPSARACSAWRSAWMRGPASRACERVAGWSCSTAPPAAGPRCWASIRWRALRARAGSGRGLGRGTRPAARRALPRARRSGSGTLPRRFPRARSPTTSARAASAPSRPVPRDPWGLPLVAGGPLRRLPRARRARAAAPGSCSARSRCDGRPDARDAPARARARARATRPAGSARASPSRRACVPRRRARAAASSACAR